MNKLSLPNFENIHTIIFDFDGVFTDNKVLVSQDGSEFVSCSKEDSLGLDILKNLIKKYNLELELFILSTEKNSVVFKRSEKLKIRCHYGITNKLDFIKGYLKKRFPSKINPQSGVVYLGNDLNDFAAMRFVGTSISPNDAHKLIKKEASFVMSKNGGDGFVREFIETLIFSNNINEHRLIDLI